MENNKLESTSVEFEYGNQQVKIETNKIARQATSAVMVSIGDLVVLTTVVAKKEADPAKSFCYLIFVFALNIRIILSSILIFFNNPLFIANHVF